ncbi:unnamed protein product [Caretta caretta]
MDEETQHSLECIQANQIFPRKQLIREDENLQVPFLELHGESTEYVGRAEDAIIALSNYRLHIKFKESVVNTVCQSDACDISVSSTMLLDHLLHLCFEQLKNVLMMLTLQRSREGLYA